MDSALDYAGLAALVMVTAGWLFGSFRKGSSNASAEAAAAWKAESEALEVRVNRLETELIQEREEKKVLEGRVQELSSQNATMSALLMGEKVPQALDDALTGIANRVIERVAETEEAIRHRVAESEDRISQGVLTMSDATAKVLVQMRDLLQKQLEA